MFLTDSVGKKGVKIQTAEDLDIEVVNPTKFFDAIDKGGNAIDLIVEQNLAPWGGKVKYFKKIIKKKIVLICYILN